ncbi:hypothetical protein [Hyalangium rubrum]|uniref:Uncharacterized protein n=1 Tax=Hyalangium rubrum TaxID=3103134 RepID=A0ABU5H655_9BACT|nr:hypothetical protein [Hyalangium sp. s54d21]MDY7228237.1 hypothetical protein [Hyalangium sp. s54d21]
MFSRSAALTFLSTLLLAPLSPAAGVEPGSPLVVQPSRPRPAPPAQPQARSISLPRFLEAPGREEPRIQLWLRFNREARGLEEGVRNFLETLLAITAQTPSDIIYSHERVQLEAESLAAEQEIEALVDARAELLVELGRMDPELALLEGELPPPWSPDGKLEPEALVGLVFARTGRSGPLNSEVERMLARLDTVERRLDAVEHQLLPTAEEALGSALLALSSAEASMLEVVHGLHFLKHQQRTRLELRVHRELILMELARQLGCRVDQLPWRLSPVAG